MRCELSSRLPEAHVRGAGPARVGARLRAARRWQRERPGGRIATWAITLGVVQAALLVEIAGRSPDRATALVGLAVVFALAAAGVAGTAWLLRMAIPVAPRAIGIVVTIFFYAAAAWVSSTLAETVLAPAAVWAVFLPAGQFAVGTRRAQT